MGTTLVSHGQRRLEEVDCFVIDPLKDHRWPDLVHSHPAGSVYHSVPWLTALKETYGYEPVVFATSAPDGSLSSGIVFCMVNSWLTGKRLVSLPFSDHCEPLARTAQECRRLLQHAKEQIHCEPLKYVEIRPATLDPSGLGFSQDVSYYFHRLDLNKSETELFAALHQNCLQRKIRRAQRERLHYEEGNSEQLLHKFYALLALTRRRHGLPPQPINWFRSLIRNFGRGLKLRVMSKGETPVASTLTLTFRDTMVYKYGCSNSEQNKLGGMPLLLWNSILEAKTQGICCFDLGRSDMDAAGLVIFKDRFGTTRTTGHYWRYPSRRVSSAHVTRFAKKLFAVMPCQVSMTLGRGLYRHIG